MASKAKGGSCCAVASCINYSGKVKNLGRDISFHRFPKDLECKKKWILKCRRKDDWNPNSSYICSEHFTAENYVRDLKAELLGYTPKVRYLKSDAIPSLNLPIDHTQTDKVSTSTLNRRNRMESRLKKQVHNEIIASAISSDVQSSSNISTIYLEDEPTQSINYKYLYDELFQEHEKVKKELVLLKEAVVTNRTINENLRFQIKQLEKNLNTVNLQLKKQKRVQKSK